MFRKLGRRVRGLLTRDYDLEGQLTQAKEQGQTLQLDLAHFYDQIEPATAALEEAKAAALSNDWKEAGFGLLDHFHDRLRPQSFIHPSDRDALRELLRAHPQDCRRWIKTSEMALQRTFAPLGGDEIQFSHSIDWYADFQGSSWMMASPEMLRRHFQLQPLDLDRQEGLRRAWSFNQLGHLVDLSRSYWLTANEGYASEAIVQAVDWADRNPIFLGVNWFYPKSVAARGLHWLMFLQPLLTSELMTGELWARMLRVLVLHAGWLALHLRQTAEYRLPCAAALYIISSHLPEVTPCKRWLTLARQHLHIALQEDFHQDGLHRSGNLSLHREATDWLMLTHLLDVLNSRPAEVLERGCLDALDALLYLKPPAGQTGEAGAALTEGILGREVSAQEHTLRLLALGGLLFGRGDLHPIPSALPAEICWWVGAEAAQRADELQREEPRGTRRLFSTGQVATVRDQWGPRANWCSLRGYQSRWTRQGRGAYSDPDPVGMPTHDDALSLALSLEGEPVFVEPGAPLVGGELGRLFGRVSAHTAVRVGRELEPFQVAPDVDEEDCRVTLEACRDGHYLRCRRPVWFDPTSPFWLTREILFLPKKQRVVVRDILEGEGEVHFESNLLLSPHLDILMRGDMGSLLRGRKLQARILPLFPGRFRYEIVKGRSQDLQGFVWSDAGRAVPTSLLRYYARVELPATVSLWIAWNPEDTLTPRPQDVEKLFKNR